MTEASFDPRAQGQALVAFRVAGQDYCIDIMSVREIRGWTPATALPHAPMHVRGVINLRGQVVPILDLAARLGVPAPEPDGRHVIVIVSVGERVLGLLVEAVSEILSVPQEAVHPAPDVAGEPSLVRAVITLQDRMYRFLDLGDVLGRDAAAA
jgi:purine-binding chemotaxis protein CheW